MMEMLFMSNYCEDCELLFLVAEQEESNLTPFCPNCGNEHGVEFKGVVYASMRDAFSKHPKSGGV